MKIREILYERVSNILYHATSFRSAKNIISSDTLKSPTGYISFTRSLTGSYHTSNRIMGIIFEVNGDKINQRYKGNPVGTEYWDDMNDDELVYHGKQNKQLEDRVIAPNGINNFLSYINNVIIFTPYEYLEQSDTDNFGEKYEQDFRYYEDVLNLLEQHNISYRLVSTESELYTRGKTSIPNPYPTSKKTNQIMFRIVLGIYDEENDSEKLRHFDVYAKNVDDARKHGEILVNKISDRYQDKEVYLKRVQNIKN